MPPSCGNATPAQPPKSGEVVASNSLKIYFVIWMSAIPTHELLSQMRMIFHPEFEVTLGRGSFGRLLLYKPAEAVWMANGSFAPSSKGIVSGMMVASRAGMKVYSLKAPFGIVLRL